MRAAQTASLPLSMASAIPDSTPLPELKGVRVLTTRPAEQAADFMAAMQAAGGEAISFPTLLITPTPTPGPVDTLLDELADFDLAIFIIANAAQFGLERLAARGESWPEGLQVASIGLATKRELELRGVRVDLIPEKRFDSEGLLELPELYVVDGLRIAIFRGVGGRETLASTLRKRGAEVEYAECYTRTKPDADFTPIQALLDRNQLHAAIVTSADGLDNLLELAGASGTAALQQRWLITPSERAQQHAIARGFQKTAVAHPPSDAQVLATLALCLQHD